MPMFKMLLKTFFKLVIVILLYRNEIGVQSDCIEPYCHCRDFSSLYCFNFTLYEQLDFRRTNDRLFRLVELKPSVAQIDLNEKLVFKGLRLNGRLSLFNVRSLNAFYNPFKEIHTEHLELSFFNSYFTFVGTIGLNSANFVAEASILNKCKFSKEALNFDFIFSNLKLDELLISNVYFERKMCPIIFRNSLIKNLLIVDPIGAFGFDYLITSNNDSVHLLNAVISQVDFTYGNDNIIQPQWLDADYILNPDLFAYLDRINLNSARRLAYIKDDTFKKLPNVKKFEINNVNLKDLLTYNRQWIQNLNFRMIPLDLEYATLNFSLTKNIFQLIVRVDENNWNFNEEKDICLFRNFPHQRLVFPFLLFSKSNLPCTCTLYWLYKYFSKYQNIYNLNQNTVPFHCFQNSNWDKCHFETLFNRYCPDSKHDPIEPFTTLKPTTDFVYITSSQSTNVFLKTSPIKTPTTRTIFPAYYSTYYHSYLSTYTTFTTIRPILTTKTSTISYTSSHNGLLSNNANCLHSILAFYMAVVLSIIASFIIASLIILFYKFLRKESRYQPKKVFEDCENNQCRDEYI